LSFTTPSDVFSQMLKIQLIAVIVLAAVLWVVFGLNASVSAILGGMSVILGAYAASLVSKKKVNTQDASAVLINLLKAEAVKIVVIIVLLLIIFKTFTALVPFALIAGLAATALFSGAALSKLNV
jgi:ATP synthase protein I